MKEINVNAQRSQTAITLVDILRINFRKILAIIWFMLHVAD